DELLDAGRGVPDAWLLELARGPLCAVPGAGCGVRGAGLMWDELAPGRVPGLGHVEGELALGRVPRSGVWVRAPPNSPRGEFPDLRHIESELVPGRVPRSATSAAALSAASRASR